MRETECASDCEPLFEALSELSQLALVQAELPVLMNVTVSVLSQSLNFDAAGIMQYMPGSGNFSIKAVTGIEKADEACMVIPGGSNSQAGYTLLSRAMVMTQDMSREKRFKPAPVLLRNGMNSGLTLILHGKSHPYGVLGVFSRSKLAFTAQEVHFLKAVCNMLSYCIVRHETEEELKAQSRKLRQYASRLMDVKEDTTARIAREIHDALGQTLTGLKYDLLALNKAVDPRERLLKMTTMMDAIDISIRTVSRISSELRPPLLDDLGLYAAIEWQLKEFQEKTGIKVRSKGISMDTSEMNGKQATAAFRILQEALTNVARHAKATLVRVSLRMDGNIFVMDVSDNGLGVEKEKITNISSFGFTGMRARAMDAGGKVTVLGRKGRGTTVTVQIPLEQDKTRQDKTRQNKA